jgi:hypothetical protein
MITLLIVDEIMPLPDGTLMVRGTRIEGPKIEKGQRGEAAYDRDRVSVEVVGTGVSDPNLDATGRQGLLLRVAKGNAANLRGRTLVFEPLSVSTCNAPTA